MTQYNKLIQKMFELQDEFNKQVHPDWKNQGYDYLLALDIEASEAIEHVGYKWWKHQDIDFEQLKMELVDIWHFGMSWLMLDINHSHNKDFITSAYNISKNKKNTTNKTYLINLIKKLKFFTLIPDDIDIYVGPLPVHEKQQFNIGLFFDIWCYLGYDLEDLYKSYIGKNVLNSFRQNNGYKNGNYIKIWNIDNNEYEDNEVLTKILNELEIDEKLYDNVMEKLQDIYNSLHKKSFNIFSDYTTNDIIFENNMNYSFKLSQDTTISLSNLDI